MSFASLARGLLARHRVPTSKSCPFGRASSDTPATTNAAVASATQPMNRKTLEAFIVISRRPTDQKRQPTPTPTSHGSIRSSPMRWPFDLTSVFMRTFFTSTLKTRFLPHC